MVERFDVAVVGTGPAGISAAITLKIRNKNILLIGNKSLSDKLWKAHEINNYPGIPNVSGEGLEKRFEEHLKQLGIEITEDKITAIYSMGDYYSLLSKNNVTYEASTVILATGIKFGKPYQGEEEFLGKGVSYCATCDAPLYRGKKVVVIGETPKEESEAKYMSELCEKVTYIPIYKGDVDGDMLETDNIEVLRDSPVSIEGGMKADKLVLKSCEVEADGIFILRDSVAPGQLVPGLVMDGNHVAVNRQMETNLPGLFACGDITGTPYQYIKAAGEGNVAALSAVNYLNNR